MIFDLSSKYSVNSLCLQMSVNRSGYYKWLKRQGTNRQDRIDEELFLYIKKVFNDVRK